MPDYFPPSRELSRLAGDLAELEQEGGGEHENAARLRGDARLLAVLRDRGFRGAATERFLNELARYGLAVIGAWLRDGVLDDKARRIGRPPAGRVDPRTLTADDRQGIADLTVAYGIELFRREVFERQRWDPAGGASLKTFFIGSCLLKYSNAAKTWRPDRDRREVPSDALADVERAGAPDPADVVVARLTAQAELDAIKDPLTREIVVANSQGLTYGQIAATVGGGLTERAVEMRLNRLRGRKGEPT